MALRIQVLASASASGRALERLTRWARSIEFAYAWMDATERDDIPWRSLPTSKIARGVVGLHFAGTDPDVLELFLAQAPNTVRAITDAAGTFHPKVIVAALGDERRAILGSSNFTTGGFSRNSEINVLLEGTLADDVFRVFDRALASYWFRSIPITPALVARYRAAWRRRPRSVDVGGVVSQRVRAIATSAELDLAWPEYVELLRYQRHRGLELDSADPEEPTYLSEMRVAQEALQSSKSFADLPYESRRAVAGFGPGIGWYGGTGANGVFKHLVRAHPKRVARIIDAVPLRGPVDDEVVMAAFAAASTLPRVGVACVTRLLCMKRPDVFYSVNAKTRQSMRQILGTVPATPTEYLASLAMIRKLRWYAAPRPSDPLEREIWRARVALLDAIFYEPA